MLNYAFRRLLSTIPVAWIATIACFFILRLAPGAAACRPYLATHACTMIFRKAKLAIIESAIAGAVSLQPGRSLSQDALARLKRNKAAVASVFVMIILIIIAIAGPWFTYRILWGRLSSHACVIAYWSCFMVNM